MILKVVPLCRACSCRTHHVALISQSVRGERVRAREGPGFFNVRSRFDYSYVCVEKARTFTHGNTAVSAAKSAGCRSRPARSRPAPGMYKSYRGKRPEKGARALGRRYISPFSTTVQYSSNRRRYSIVLYPVPGYSTVPYSILFVFIALLFVVV